MPAHCLLGLRIAWSWETGFFNGDPVRSLFSGELRDEPASAGIEIHLIEMAAPPSDPAQDPSLHLYFLQGAIWVFADHSKEYGINTKKLILWDGAHRIGVDRSDAQQPKIQAYLLRGALPEQSKTIVQLSIVIALLGHGVFPLHAAALLHPGGCRILLSGASGSGKSTAALSLVDAGYSCAGDDTVYLREWAGRLELFSFARAFAIGPEARDAFAHLAEMWGAWADAPGRSKKRLLNLEKAYPNRLISTFTLGDAPLLLLFPKIDRHLKKTSATPLSKADALGHLSAQSAALMLEGLGDRTQNFKMLAALVARARAYELDLGLDMLNAPAQTIAALVSPLVGGAQ